MKLRPLRGSFEVSESLFSELKLSSVHEEELSWINLIVKAGPAAVLCSWRGRRTAAAAFDDETKSLLPK